MDVLKYFHSIVDISEGIKARDWQSVKLANENKHLKVVEYFNSIVKLPESLYSVKE